MSHRYRKLLAAVLIFTAAVAVTPAQERSPIASSTFTSTPAAIAVDDVPDVLVGPASGVEVSRLLSGADGSELASGYPFGPDFAGGVRVAAGDVNGDGIPDPIVGTGPGSAYVNVYSGADISSIVGGRPFGPDFNGGVYVASGDFDNDGRADIVVGQGEGGGAVAVFRANSTPIATLTPFGAGYTGGVRVAAGDVNGDGVADLLVAQASGAGLVTIINGATGAPIVSAAPYGPIAGGVFVAAGDITGDDIDDVIVAPGTGNAPVLLFDLKNGSAIGSFTAYAPGFTAGVHVAAADLTGDGRADIIVAPGPGSQPLLRVFDGATLAPIIGLLAYDAAFTGGMFVASIDVPRPPQVTSAASVTFQAGESNTFTVTTAGRPAITSISSSGVLPSGVTFTDLGDGTATIAGTSPLGTTGEFPLTLTATNRAGVSVTQDFALTVESRCPVITVMPTTLPDAVVGVPWTTSFTQSGALGSVTWSLTGSIPNGFTFDSATGQLSGIAVDGTSGTHSFTVAATDQSCTGSVAATLTVRANQAPTLASATIAYDTVGNTQLHVAGATRPGVTARIDAAAILAKSGAADGDGPAPLSVVPQSNVATANGLVSVAADGSFSYVPAIGFAGVDTFIAQVTDSLVSVNVTVNITVAGRVWYVNNRVDGNNAAGGDGRSTDAFETLAAAETASGDGDIIFVFVGDSAASVLTGGITLKNGQQLVGEFVGLTVGATTLVPPSAIHPVIVVDGRPVVVVRADDEAGNRTGVAIRGLDLRATNADKVVEVSTGGVATLDLAVSGNRIHGQLRGSTVGLSVAHASAGIAKVSIHDNVIDDVIGGMNLEATSNPSLYISDLSNNTVVGPGVFGIGVLGGIFDAVPGGTFDAVSGGNTRLGSADVPLVLAGMVFVNVSGALAFDELRMWLAAPPEAQGLRAGVYVQGAGSYTGTSGMALGIADGSVNGITASGVALAGLTADVHLGSLSTKGGEVGLALNQVDGTVVVLSGAIEDTTNPGASVSIIGGSANVTYGGSISRPATIGQLVNIDANVGGTMRFTGPIEGDGGFGNGIQLTRNTGATITFAGGVRPSSTGGVAFYADAGGTIAVCATQSCEPDGAPLVNTLQTTAGRALQVKDVAIGAQHLTFRSINAGNGSTEAVVVERTGTSGGLHVTGTGAAGSGGTITGRNGAFNLNTTSDVSLNWMALRDYGIAAIAASNTHNFELRNSVVSSTTAIGIEASSLMFSDVTGNVRIENTSISGGAKNNIAVRNSSGVLDRLVLSNITVGDNSATFGGDAVEVVASGAGTTMNVTVENSTFTAARERLFAFSMSNATGDLVFTGNTLNNTRADRELYGNLNVTTAGLASLTYRIADNDINGAFGSAIEVFKEEGEGATNGEISDNRIGTSGIANSGSRNKSALIVANVAGGVHSSKILSNTIFEYDGGAIHALSGSSGALNVSVNGMTVQQPGANGGSSLRIQAGASSSDASTMCADIGNEAVNLLSSGNVALIMNGSATLRLPDYDGAPRDQAALATFLGPRTGGAAPFDFQFNGVNGVTGGPGSCIP